MEELLQESIQVQICQRLPAVLVRAAQRQRSLQEVNTPAPFSIMAQFHVGDKIIMGNWVTEEHPIKPRQHLPAALERVAQQLRSLQDIVTPASFSIMAQFHVGAVTLSGNWVTEEHPIKPRQHLPATLEQAVLQQPSLLEIITPVLFSITARFHVGETEIRVNWVTEVISTNFCPLLPIVLERIVLQWRSLLQGTIPV